MRSLTAEVSRCICLDPFATDTLSKKLKEYGNLTSLFYMMDQTQSHRGWAFATFETADEASTAIEALNGKEIFPDSKSPLEARFANQKPSTTSPSFHLTGEVARKIWQEYHTEEGIPYYYNSISGLTQWEKPPELEILPARPGAQSRASVGMLGNSATNFGPPGSNIFVFHVPHDWNDIDLVQHFQHFGNILSSRIQRDSQGKSRGFGFVSFDNPQAAVNAIRGMHGFCVAGRFLRVQLKKGEECFLTAAMQTQIADIINNEQQRSRSYRAPY